MDWESVQVWLVERGPPAHTPGNSLAAWTVFLGWVVPGPTDVYLVSRSGPESLGKRLEAAKCRRHTAPRGVTPAAGLQGTLNGGRSSGRPRWHRCRPGGTLGGPRHPHPRLQVPIRPLRAAASHEREAERWRSAWGIAAQCGVHGPGASPSQSSKLYPASKICAFLMLPPPTFNKQRRELVQ